jgi:hypothetical protein
MTLFFLSFKFPCVTTGLLHVHCFSRPHKCGTNLTLCHKHKENDLQKGLHVDHLIFLSSASFFPVSVEGIWR